MIQRGDVFWVDLRAPSGSEPGYRRPMVVVQADSFNRSRLRTVIGVICTTAERHADAPGNVVLLAGETGLPRNSVANVTQVVTADRAQLGRRIGSVPTELLARVDAGLRLVLDL